MFDQPKKSGSLSLEDLMLKESGIAVKFGDCCHNRGIMYAKKSAEVNQRIIKRVRLLRKIPTASAHSL